jgi:bifunctional non-homologous end joining protein LigD
MPLVQRKANPRELLIAADDHVLRYSDEFSDAAKLLAVAEKNGLEGVVSKLSNQPYRSGENLGWIKVKCAAWREANRDGGELFQR